MQLERKMSTTKAFSPGTLKFNNNNHHVTQVMKFKVSPILKEQKQLQKLIISVIWNVKSLPRINFLDILSHCLYFVSSKLLSKYGLQLVDVGDSTLRADLYYSLFPFDFE